MSAPIRHIEKWRLRGETPEERPAARLKVRTAFERFKGRIKGLNHIEVGVGAELLRPIFGGLSPREGGFQ